MQNWKLDKEEEFARDRVRLGPKESYPHHVELQSGQAGQLSEDLIVDAPLFYIFVLHCYFFAMLYIHECSVKTIH